MAITLDGTSGITTPDVNSDGLTVDSTTLVVDETNNRVGIGTSSPDTTMHVEGNLLVDAYNAVGEGGGIFFRQGFLSTAQPSITVKDHSGSAPDGISVNGYDGVSFRTQDTERARIDSSGRLLVNRTTGLANGRICVTGGGAEACSFQGGSNGYTVTFHNTSGTLIGSITGATGSSTAYNTTSDYRLKENVVGVTGAAARVQQLNPVRFNFIADPDTTVDGFLAHEVQDVVPEAITGTKDAVDAEGNPEYQGIDQSKLVPLLTAALQEALTKIDSLETRIAALEAA